MLIKLLIVTVFSFMGGVVQTVTGFGAGIVMMLAFPYFFDITKAPALSQAVTMALSGSLAWKFRKKIDLKKTGIPTLIYVAVSQAAIYMIKYLDMDLIRLIYGLFLVALAVYYFIPKKKKEKPAGTAEMLIDTGVSGLASGFFGIGGPLMAVFYSGIFPLGEIYAANIQFTFFAGSIMSFATRIMRGIYTKDLILYTVVGITYITLGRELGLKITGKINGVMLKKIIYIFVAVSGIITVLK